YERRPEQEVAAARKAEADEDEIETQNLEAPGDSAQERHSEQGSGREESVTAVVELLCVTGEAREQRQRFEPAEEPVGEALMARATHEQAAAGHDKDENRPGVTEHEEPCRAEEHEAEAVRQPLGDDDRRRTAKRRSVELAEKVALQPLAHLAGRNHHAETGEIGERAFASREIAHADRPQIVLPFEEAE